MRTIIFTAFILATIMIAQAQETRKDQHDGSYDTDSVPTTEQTKPTESKKGEPDGSGYHSPDTPKPEEKK